MHYDPRLLLEGNIITEPLQNYGRGFGLSTSEDTFCTNYTGTLLNIEECTCITKDNPCGHIHKPVTGNTLENDNIHIVHDMSKTIYLWNPWSQS